MITKLVLPAGVPKEVINGADVIPTEFRNDSPGSIELWEGAPSDYGTAVTLVVKRRHIVRLPDSQFSARSELDGELTILENVSILDSGIPVESTDHVPVALQDQHTEMVVLPFHIELNPNAPLAIPAVPDELTVTLAPGHGVIAGNVLTISEGSHIFWAGVLGVVVDVITIDSPLDAAFTTSALVSVGNPNLNVNGSATTQVAHVKPMAGSKWDITRIHMRIIDSTIMDAGTFGGRSALANGLVMRSSNGTNKNVGNAKTNGDLSLLSTSYAFDDKPPSGKFGFSTFHVFGGQGNVGVVIRLIGDDSDELQMLIQDDLTGLDSFKIMAIGHVVAD